MAGVIASPVPPWSRDDVGAIQYRVEVSVPISELSVREVRERFAEPNAPITRRVLEELERDPRSGVRAVHQALLRRRDAARAERARLRRLLRLERSLWDQGITLVAGVDEAGMAPLAGPVVAAAVIIPHDGSAAQTIEGVDDSKRLDPARREELAALIRERAAAVAVGLADVADIDHHNIYWAGILAMRRAVSALPVAPAHVITDARAIPELGIPQTACPGGDANHYSIAAASIIAKTHRDQLMNELDARYPGYGFAQHKGYPTAAHQQAIRERGPCAAHRTSFTYFRELLGECSPTFYELSRALDGAPSPAALDEVDTRLRAARGSLAESEYRKLKTLLSRRRGRR
jgi:ribonuclease HII